MSVRRRSGVWSSGTFPSPSSRSSLGDVQLSGCLSPYSVFCVKLRKSWGGLYCLKKETKKEKPNHIFPLFTVWFCPCTHHKERRRFFQRTNLLIPKPTPSNHSGDLPHGAASSSLWTKEHPACLLILRHCVFL